MLNINILEKAGYKIHPLPNGQYSVRFPWQYGRDVLKIYDFDDIQSLIKYLGKSEMSGRTFEKARENNKYGKKINNRHLRRQAKREISEENS